MRARYAGRCNVCDTSFNIGEEIFYSPIRGTRHADEDGCHNAQDHARQMDGLEGEGP